MKPMPMSLPCGASQLAGFSYQKLQAIVLTAVLHVKWMYLIGDTEVAVVDKTRNPRFLCCLFWKKELMKNLMLH